MTTPTWTTDDQPGLAEITFMGWVRVVRRGLPAVILVFGLWFIFLPLRLIEWALVGTNRPVTPYITQFACRHIFFFLGIKLTAVGTPMQGEGAAISNHASWLDVFAIHAFDRVYFVAKSEVAGWPGIGWLARTTGTHFVVRDRKLAKIQNEELRERLHMGHRLALFPEGTTTDGRRVLPFKPTLFQAFFDPDLRDTQKIQAITLTYHAPEDQDPRFYGWWGDMEFGTHLLKTLAARHQGHIVLTYHDPVSVRDFENRKLLSWDLETKVRGALPFPDDGA